MGSIFGGGSTETKVTQTRQIPPPTSQETQLLSDLFDIAHTEYYKPSEEFLDVLSKHYEPSEKYLETLASPYTPTPSFTSLVGQYYQPSEEFLKVMSKHYEPSKELLDVLAKHYEPSPQFVSEMSNPYLSMLPYQEEWGRYLNQMATRGVINSTIAQEAMKELGTRLAERGRELRWAGLQALEAARRQALEDEYRRSLERERAIIRSMEDEFRRALEKEKAISASKMDQWRRALEYERAYRASLEDKLRRAELEEEARRRALADELARAATREEALRYSGEERYKNLFNLWSTLYSGRMGVPTTVSTTEGPSPFSQIAGSALGLGLGYWLGPGGGLSWLGSGLAGLLGLGGSAAAEAAAGSMAGKLAAQFGSPFSSALGALVF